MRLSAYWKIVLKRLVDGVALHLLLSLQRLVNGGRDCERVNGGSRWSNGVDDGRKSRPPLLKSARG